MHVQLTMIASKRTLEGMHTSLRATTALLAASGLLFTAACSTDSDSGSGTDSGSGDSGDKKISIVASTSIWADVAQAVADTASGIDIEVEPIVEGNDTDPTTSSPPRPM